MDSSSSGRRRGPGFVTPNACTECRKKRVKCDGKTPCSRCVASENRANCAYEVPLRQTKEEMRSEINYLRAYQQQSKRVLGALASDKQCSEILNQLRNGEQLEDISRKLEISASTSNHEESSPSLHQPTARSTRKSSIVEDSYQQSPTHSQIESRIQIGQQALLGDETDSLDPLSHHGPKHHNESWTTVTSDGDLVEHLLALYFCWEYPIFATVSKEHFMEDFRKGYRRYCSSLLVNALLAVACRFSDRPSTRRDAEDGTTAGDAFFEEAWRIYRSENDHHKLTTVQALGMMSIREASCGRMSESGFLSAQSIRVAIEMGLHIRDDINEDDEDEDETEKAVRKATFWGAYSLNEMLSLCTGTLPHLSRHVNFPTKPALIHHVEEALWVPYTDDGIPLDHHFDQPSNLRSVYKTFCELSERVHNVLYTIYSPGFEASSEELIALYHQYIHWYDTIPDNIRLGHNFTPAVLFAHLFYHSATLLLFQPFIMLRLGTSTVIPRDVCYQAANAITGIVKSYSDLYTLRRTPSFVPYFVLVSTIIHLVAVKNDPRNTDTRQKLSQGMSDLHEMAKCHGFALRALDAVRYMASRWGVDASHDTEGDRDMADISHGSTKIQGSSEPDVKILQTLQSIHPVISSQDHHLFSSFSSLPLFHSDRKLENEPFAENIQKQALE